MGTGEIVIRLRTPVGDVAAAVLPDGSVVGLVATGVTPRTVRAWDLSTGARLGEALLVATAVATPVLADGRVVAVIGGGEGTVRVSHLTTGECAAPPLTDRTGVVLAVATARALLITAARYRGATSAAPWPVASHPPSVVLAALR